MGAGTPYTNTIDVALPPDQAFQRLLGAVAGADRVSVDYAGPNTVAITTSFPTEILTVSATPVDAGRTRRTFIGKASAELVARFGSLFGSIGDGVPHAASLTAERAVDEDRPGPPNPLEVHENFYTVQPAPSTIATYDLTICWCPTCETWLQQRRSSVISVGSADSLAVRVRCRRARRAPPGKQSSAATPRSPLGHPRT